MFRSPTDEIYKETPGSGRGTHIFQLLKNYENVYVTLKKMCDALLLMYN
jgi:hypothetical protein